MPVSEEDVRLLGLDGLQTEEILVEGNSVYYVLPVDQLGPEEFPIRGIFPKDAEFKVDPHFHPHTNEYFQCLAGQIHVYIDGVHHLVTPESGVLTIPAGTVHSVHSPRGEHAVACERTDTARDTHTLQVYCLLSGQRDGTLSTAGALRIFYQWGEMFPGLQPRHNAMTSALAKLMVYVVGGGMYHLVGPHPVKLEASR